jgi:hypothetical protein
VTCVVEELVRSGRSRAFGVHRAEARSLEPARQLPRGSGTRVPAGERVQAAGWSRAGKRVPGVALVKGN